MASLLTKRYVKIYSRHIGLQTYSISKTQQFFHTFAFMARFAFWLIIFSSILTNGFSQRSESSIDLSDQWFVFQNDLPVKIRKSDADGANTISFSINTNAVAGHDLQIVSSKPFFLFANGKLIIQHVGSLLLNLDSTATTIGSPTITFSVFQKNIDTRDLVTSIVRKQVVREGSTLNTKPPTFFRDFIVTAGLSLVIFFVIIIRTNGKLASEYLSPSRIFSMREAIDNQSHSRFAISSGVFFYIFCSLLFAWCMLIIFHNLPDGFYLSRYFRTESFWTTVWIWIRLATILLLFFFLKILMVNTLASLFGLVGIAGIHFFNWVRFFILLSGASSIIVFIYFIRSGHESDFYSGLLIGIIVLLAAWIVTVFLKLNNRSEHSLFHLFSYICATEIIPLLLSVKVLFN